MPANDNIGADRLWPRGAASKMGGTMFDLNVGAFRSRTSRLLTAAAMALTCLTAGAEQPVEVIATGLNNPRGLAFGPGGGLFVAEAGVGGPSSECVPSPDSPAMRCYGATGSVARVNIRGGQDPTQSWKRVIDKLPSIAPQDDPTTPEDDGGMGASGPVDVGFRGSQLYVLMGLGGSPALRSQLPTAGKYFGTILEADLDGFDFRFPWGFHGRPRNKPDWRIVADISAHEARHNPDGIYGAPADSNPYGLEVLPWRFIVADAGANALVEAWPNGLTRTLAVFGPFTLTLPPGAPPGPGPWSVQPVPTSVTLGPDLALYSTELTGFPFAEGASRVHRVLPFGHDESVWLDEFTNVIDMAFDAAGNAYVLEVAHRLFPPNAPPPGRLIKVDRDTHARTILASSLVMPGGVVVGPDRALYVTNFGVFKGAGQVVRIALP
jgi:hypothetical protein